MQVHRDKLCQRASESKLALQAQFDSFVTNKMGFYG